MRIVLTLVFLAGFGWPAAAEVALFPPVIDTGGVTVVRWQGAPPITATVEFNGRQVSAWPTADGVLALLGTDLEAPPGSYPVTVVGRDREGKAFTAVLTLEVRAPRRPEERLSLPPAMVTPTDPQLQLRIAREQKLLRELYARDSAPPAWDSFVLPVADPLGSPFGLRRILNGEPKSPHAGVDFRSPRGTEVAAAGHGRAVFVGDLYYSGLTVILDHGAGLFSIYAHLEEILCREQQPVERGAIVGRVGSTGRSTGPHLHWGVRLRGDRVDPLEIIRALTVQGP